MFRPNLKCQTSIMSGSDGYGKRTYAAWKSTPFAIVKMEVMSDKTSVRTDSSASRGSAQEILADARFLFPRYITLNPGDRVQFGEFTFTVVSTWPRHSVLGTFDHWQVDCNVYWEKP